MLLFAWARAALAAAGSPAANDNWAAATPLTGATAIVTGNTAGATAEAGEPAVPGNTAGQTVWWTWTAPGDGLLALEVEESDFSTAVAIYAGEALSSLQLRSSNASVWGNCWSTETRMRPKLQATVEAGRRYFIAADWNRFVPVAPGFPGIDQPACVECPPVEPPPMGGAVAFALKFQPAPANDRLAAAVDLVGDLGEAAADTASAGTELGEPGGLYRTVWWKWVAPRSGWLSLGADVPAAKPAPSAETLEARLPVPAYDHPLGWPAGTVIPIGSPTNGGSGGGGGGSTTGVIFIGGGGGGGGDLINCFQLVEQNPQPSFEPALKVFAGDSLPELRLVAVGTPSQTFRTRVEAGTTYRFALGSQTDAGGPASFKFRLTAPENDDFSQRIAISGVEARATGHLAGATQEPGEPNHLSGASGHSAWWTWTAPDDGLADWTVTSTNFTPVLAAYHGLELTALSRIPAGNSPSNLNFRVKAGERVQLAVDALGAEGEGDYTLALKVEPLAPELDSAPTRLIDGSTQFRVNHLRGRGFLVFGSGDLQGWQFLWAGVVNSDAAVFRDFAAIGTGVRYYVVRLALPGEEQWFVPPPASGPESVPMETRERRPPSGKHPSRYQIP